ncbi:MAG TPA: DUF2167 domain-containing protein [Steroidobacteraceae bacterium]|jgi:uncharacterized membrane-anchored protein
MNSKGTLRAIYIAICALGLAVAGLSAATPALAQNSDTTDSSDSPNGSGQQSTDPRVEEFRRKLRALNWVVGPKSVTIAGNSTLEIPDGYVFLDAANTSKFEELNENLSSGKEVMIAPKNLSWSAYLIFEGEGYVKDDEKIDAPAILKSLQQATEDSNEERRRRGYRQIHVVGWAIAPAYNTTTKRLEWATRLRADESEGVNFSTKILGRKGYTSVVMATAPERIGPAVEDLNRIIGGYQFNAGDTYAEWRPGEKVAEYGLAGLIVGGAAAAAVKTGLFKGLFKFLAAGIAAAWKFIVVIVAALGGALKKFFSKKDAGTGSPPASGS